MKNSFENFDIIIAGCGPAGMATAHQLSGFGLKIAILEKEKFPRDKICGDALSTDVVNQFIKMDRSLLDDFRESVRHLDSHGVRIVAPNHRQMDTSYFNQNTSEPAGFLVKRIDFDNYFFQKIKALDDVHVFENLKVMDIKYDEEGVIITTSGEKQFQAKMIVGADGANSIVNHLLAKKVEDKYHYCMGLRQYYTNVSGFHPDNYVELHFYKELLPGYFWIFPLPGNQANVGIGMLANSIRKKKINLQKIMEELITNHPNLKERFKDATPLEGIQGLRLPMISKRRPLSGNRFLLAGDAASLIDPFTGEGVGNAIRSGRIAAQHLKEVFQHQRFEAAFNRKYDQKIYAMMYNEAKVSGILQRIIQYPKMVNLLVNKADKNPAFKTLIESMLDNKDPKRELLKPRFLFKLLFG